MERAEKRSASADVCITNYPLADVISKNEISEMESFS